MARRKTINEPRRPNQHPQLAVEEGRCAGHSHHSHAANVPSSLTCANHLCEWERCVVNEEEAVLSWASIEETTRVKCVELPGLDLGKSCCICEESMTSRRVAQTGALSPRSVTCWTSVTMNGNHRSWRRTGWTLLQMIYVAFGACRYEDLGRNCAE